MRRGDAYSFQNTHRKVFWVGVVVRKRLLKPLMTDDERNLPLQRELFCFPSGPASSLGGFSLVLLTTTFACFLSSSNNNALKLRFLFL